MADFPLVQGNKILCLACQEEGKIFYAGRITAKHLIGKHKSLFPDITTAIQEYKKRYPKGGIAANTRTRALSGNMAIVPDGLNSSPGVKEDYLEWKRENKKLFDELEEVKKQLEETEDPVRIKKLKLRKDLILGQQKVIKEVTPGRGTFNPDSESSSKLNPLQIKALEDIAPLLEKISGNLDGLCKVDESVAKCLS